MSLRFGNHWSTNEPSKPENCLGIWAHGKEAKFLKTWSSTALSIDPKFGRSVMDCRMTFFHHSMYKNSQDSVDFTYWYLLCQPLLDCRFKAFPKSFLLAVVGTCKWQVECLQTHISRLPNYSDLALDQQGVFSKMKVWKYLNFLRQYHFMIKFSNEESSFTIKAFLIQRMLLFSKVLDALTSSSFKVPVFSCPR